MASSICWAKQKRPERPALPTRQEASLQPHHRFCDVGSGLGKLVLCAAVVTCAECYGVEISPHRLR